MRNTKFWLCALNFAQPSSSLSTFCRNAKGDLPESFHLEHVKQRLIYTVPLMFRTKLDYTFYRDNVVLENQILRYRISGLSKLMAHMGIISAAGQFLFPHIEMEVIGICTVLQDGTVRLHWRIKYVSFLRLLFNPMLFKASYRADKLDWYDGYSIFFVDGDGLVHKVTIQNVRQDEGSMYSSKTLAQRLVEKLSVLPKNAVALAMLSDEEFLKHISF